MSSTCRVCNAASVKICSRCQTVYYCTKEHQIEDWPKHKADCHKTTSKNTKPEEPAASAGDAVTGILFAVNEDKPRLVRIPIQDMPAEDGELSWRRLDRDPWYTNWPGQGTDCSLRTMYPWLPPTYKLPPGQHLHIKYDDNSMINGSVLNRCIQRFTSGKAKHPWFRNIIAVRADRLCEEQF